MHFFVTYYRFRCLNRVHNPGDAYRQQLLVLRQVPPLHHDNPLKDLIDDQTFAELERLKLFSDKAIRDYKIRRLFKSMRETMSAGDAIDQIREMYPYLQFDTVRKIVYQISK